MIYFSNNLKFLHEKSKKSQKEMAKELEFKSSSRLNNYEKGNSKPELDVLMRLSTKYNILIDDLLNKDLENSNDLNLSPNKPTESIDKDYIIETQRKCIDLLEQQLRMLQDVRPQIASTTDVRNAG